MTGLDDLDHEQLREALGAYSLGQLDDPLRGAVRAHLTACDTCPAELAEIGPIARALRSVDPDAVRPVDVGVPAGLDDRIRRALPPAPLPTRSRGRRGPLVTAAVAVASAAAAVVLTAVVVGDDAPSGPTVIAVPEVQVVQGVRATAGLVDHTWGLEIKLQATGLRAGERFRMWVVADDGSSREAGEFVGVAGTEITCDMSSSVLLDDAAAFRVVDASGDEVISADIPS
ncbi:zf-HC2 domain-containing protein [Aeromicrobium sp. CFBP 8757]|uniref:anti-sigma factor n=1 Tax=Aeromicrobium sp. CFBP 8757 TaxID=2775288 RepID=UPI001780894C|nr:zf-HC2 domain-containing protein [Aeromicrobium sp. CFBP 8757]MBD8607208.1 zf-HC2 domain-containing protein [Aeromicrobium sp. CFBP 8757]